MRPFEPTFDWNTDGTPDADPTVPQAGPVTVPLGLNRNHVFVQASWPGIPWNDAERIYGFTPDPWTAGPPPRQAFPTSLTVPPGTPPGVYSVNAACLVFEALPSGTLTASVWHLKTPFTVYADLVGTEIPWSWAVSAPLNALGAFVPDGFVSTGVLSPWGPRTAAPPTTTTAPTTAPPATAPAPTAPPATAPPATAPPATTPTTRPAPPTIVY